MDSKVKVELMIQTMLNDPNTTDETRVLIAELLSNDQIEEQNKKWFSYIDLTYTQTREDNISAITKTKTLLQDDVSIPFPEIDNKLIVADEKIDNMGSSITFGKNFDNTSSVYFNFGLDIAKQHKKVTGDSDIISGSASYFKAKGNHYFSPYIYYSRPNYRRLEDYNTKGVGFNNTYADACLKNLPIELFNSLLNSTVCKSLLHAYAVLLNKLLSYCSNCAS